jgi:hypothetical protein
MIKVFEFGPGTPHIFLFAETSPRKLGAPKSRERIPRTATNAAPVKDKNWEANSENKDEIGKSSCTSPLCSQSQTDLPIVSWVCSERRMARCAHTMIPKLGASSAGTS